MKKISIIATLCVLLFSCSNSNDSNTKYSYSVNHNGEVHREMVLKNKLSDIEIKMEGNAVFDKNDSVISSITADGKIDYRNGNIKVKMEPSKNGVTLKIEENGNKISPTSDTGKEIMTEAIRHIKKLQHKNK